MTTEFGYALAFVTGVAGALHCLGMCSGLAAGFGAIRGARRPLAAAAAYHATRIAVYILLGAAGAALGRTLVQTGVIGKGQGLLMIAAGFGVIAIGLYLARGASRAESGGVEVALPLRHFSAPPRSSLLTPALGGLLNGFVPCSLVFSVALKATATADPLRGSLLMAVFGLGTLPAMFTASLLAAYLGERLRGPWPRRLLGLVVVSLGAWTAYEGWIFFDVMRGLADW